MKKVVILIIGILYIQSGFSQECLDVKFKIRGYFYAGTSQIDSLALGGFYADKNIPKTITKEILELSSDNNLQLIAFTNSEIEVQKNILGFKVYLVNKSDSIIGLPAQDSRLYLKRQVFYKGKWKDIEYLPSSWCGNSYHNVFIEPNQYWEFNAPCLKGKIKSKFRFELYVNENLSIYSNEFSGSFNKSQLKKEQGYSSKGLMDPYNN